MGPFFYSKYTAQQVENLLDKAANAAKPLTNCINCGAPLHGRRCEYCGTQYDGTVEISGEVSEVTCEGTITLGGKSCRVYLSGIEVEAEVLGPSERDICGNICRSPVRHRRKFTLVEL